MYFPRSLSPSCWYRVLCCVQMHLYTLKQIWSLVWLKQLQNRGTVIAAKTIISRGLFWFLFCFLVLEILITNKKSPVNLAEILVPTPSQRGRVFGIENKSGLPRCKILQSVEFWEPDSPVQWTWGKTTACVCLLYFVFLLNEEKACLRVPYFYWSKSKWYRKKKKEISFLVAAFLLMILNAL